MSETYQDFTEDGIDPWEALSSATDTIATLSRRLKQAEAALAAVCALDGTPDVLHIALKSIAEHYFALAPSPSEESGE